MYSVVHNVCDIIRYNINCKMQQSFSHIEMVPVFDRELNAHF